MKDRVLINVFYLPLLSGFSREIARVSGQKIGQLKHTAENIVNICDERAREGAIVEACDIIGPAGVV